MLKRPKRPWGQLVVFEDRKLWGQVSGFCESHGAGSVVLEGQRDVPNCYFEDVQRLMR